MVIRTRATSCTRSLPEKVPTRCGEAAIRPIADAVRGVAPDLGAAQAPRVHRSGARGRPRQRARRLRNRSKYIAIRKTLAPGPGRDDEYGSRSRAWRIWMMRLRSSSYVAPGLLALFVAACATGSPDDKATGGPSNDTTSGGLAGQPILQVIHQDAQDVSPPLDELLRMAAPQLGERAHEAEPVRPIPHMRRQSTGPVIDPVVQSSLGAPLIPTTSANFEGAGTGLAGFTVNVAPPDTDGDVGPNHYVQVVNSSVTIFNKSGGIIRAPFATNTLWAGFNGQCATTNDGDGVVRYDHFADRWVIAQFSVNGGNGPFFQCIAVSTTGDPTGTYNRYQFSFNSFNDYPKMGLAQTGYYFTYNLFSTTAFLGAQVCAADRAKMIAGAAATQVCFTTSNQFGGLLPADDDTPPPPMGSIPNPLWWV
ncbi:MAG TPA: hypothetical protein VFK02_04280, partial [Kofleriaceae bacterium]|nr:hypothetical protein [Kofleriaceae bacterium]